MLKDQLQTSLKSALKARDKVRLDTVRSVLSAIQYEAMEKKVDDLNDDGILSVLQREIKKRREEAEFAEQAKRPELIEKLKVEISILESFLPKQLSADEVEKILGDLKSATPGINMGAAMKLLKEKYSGQYDGKLASEIARRVLG